MRIHFTRKNLGIPYVLFLLIFVVMPLLVLFTLLLLMARVSLL